jgi:hypothetical protein
LPEYEDMQDPDLRPEQRLGTDREALAPVRESLLEAGFYAYGMVGEDHRWTIAIDDELGRADVRIGDDGLEVILTATSPGLYADEESDWRRSSRARLARISLPNITRGFLEPNQVARWDEVEEGVAITETWQLPFVRAHDVGTFVRDYLPRLSDVLTRIESQLG